jgi:hypothetical protein
MTVADLRRALERLPDDAPVYVRLTNPENMPGGTPAAKAVWAGGENRGGMGEPLTQVFVFVAAMMYYR